MAYMNENAQLGGLFDFLAVTAATKAVAQGQVPIVSNLLKTPGIKPLQVTQPDKPPLSSSSPLPQAAPAPKAVAQPMANQVQDIITGIASAFASLRKSEQPLATAIGTGLAPDRPPSNSTAMKVHGAPSGQLPTSPPVNTQTYEIVNANSGALVPMPKAAPMPAWVVPAALIGGGAILFMALRNR